MDYHIKLNLIIDEQNHDKCIEVFKELSTVGVAPLSGLGVCLWVSLGSSYMTSNHSGGPVFFRPDDISSYYRYHAAIMFYYPGYLQRTLFRPLSCKSGW